MTDKQLFVLACIVFFLGVYIMGMIGRGCVDECQQDGTSEAVCYNLCRP